MKNSDIIKNKLKSQTNLSDFYKLKKLVHEMQKSLLIEHSFDQNSVNRFSWTSKKKNNPFGYSLLKDQKLNKKSFYRKNRLRHKLIRIQKQFEFVKKNIKKYQKLTRREKEIIQLLALGNNNPVIAEKLFISRCTVEQHRKNINRKLKIKSLAELIWYSYAYDLV
ncbi:MAG: helix-turn-helix transcriptional regulator [Bacteroidota bacterium]